MVFNGILILHLLLFVESCNWNLKTMNRNVISSFDEEISWNITRKNGYCKLIINLPSALILRSTQFCINLMQDRGLLLIINKEPIDIYIQTRRCWIFHYYSLEENIYYIVLRFQEVVKHDLKIWIKDASAVWFLRNVETSFPSCIILFSG